MSARQAVDTAIAAGIKLEIEGEKLIVEFDGQIPDAVVADLKRHKAEILSLLQAGESMTATPACRQESSDAPQPQPVAPIPAPWPEPTIKAVPPFGSSKVPSRYEAGWKALLAGQPSWCTEAQWCDAIFGCRDLFGEWGAELLRLNWQPENIFDRWHGLAWFLKNSAVTAIGRCHVFLHDGRIFERKRR